MLDQADVLLRRHSKNIEHPEELTLQNKIRVYQAFLTLEYLNPSCDLGIDALKLVTDNTRFLIEKYGQKVFNATLLKARQAWMDKEVNE